MGKNKKRKGCPECGRPLRRDNSVADTEEQPIVLNPAITPNPELIYKRVLEIGSECITCGISFNQLYHRLKYHENFEFDENGCLERCLRQWFWHSFFHEEAHCGFGSDVNELDNHLDCNFILRAESCMKLLTFKESEQNERTAKLNVETAKTALKNSKIANNVAIIGLGLSLLGIGHSIYKDNFVECSQDKYLKELIQKQEESNDIIKSFLYNKSDTTRKIQLKR